MFTRRNIPAALAGLAIQFLLVVALPDTAMAQDDPEDPEENPDTVCGRCAWSDDSPWNSIECRADMPANPDFPDSFCVTWDGVGDTEFCRYDKERGCDGIGDENEVALANDLEAVGRVMRGDVLPSSGNHFFLVDAEGAAAVMRKCDRSVVARISPETLATARRGRSAIQVG